jgi:TM2 domain-containing membrane protein YozV
MAEYHGDIAYRVGTIYESRDEGNYFIAILFLLFFGGLGAHRFYLNDTRTGWMYLAPFAIAAFVAFATLNLTALVWEASIASVFLLGELVYFIYKLVSR